MRCVSAANPCFNLAGRHAWLLLLLLAFGPAAAEQCPSPAPARAVVPVADSWTVATQNLWRLMDARRRDAEDEVPSQDRVDARLQALAAYMDERLHWPHLLLVQEVENRGLLEALVKRIEQRGGPRYSVWLMEGQDPSGIDVGALARPPVRIDRMRPLFADQRLGVQWLFSRPPLRLTLAEPVSMEVLVLHLRSGRGLHDPDLGAGVQAKRRAQAHAVRDWVRNQRQTGARILVAGDLNSAPGAGPFSEPLSELLDAPLLSLWNQLPEAERYSYVYRCRPQAIDHMLVTDNLLPMVRSVQVTRGNAGRYRELHESGGVRVISDHDALLVNFALPVKDEDAD